MLVGGAAGDFNKQGEAGAEPAATLSEPIVYVERP